MALPVDEKVLNARMLTAEAAHAAHPAADSLRQLCRLYFMGGKLGESYLEKGMAHATAGVATYPNQALFKVYQAAYALSEAHYLATPLAQYSRASAALYKLDVLHARYHKVLEVRYVHTAATYNLPAIMGRTGAAQTAVLTLLREAVKGFDEPDTSLVADVLDFLLLTGMAVRSQQLALQAQRAALTP